MTSHSTASSGGHGEPEGLAMTDSTDSPKLASIYANDILHTSSTPEINDIKAELMCNWLHQQQVQRMWSSGGPGEGVFLKKSKDEYVCCPEDLGSHQDHLLTSIKQLNVRCAMTVNTQIVKIFLRQKDATHVPLENGLRVQILPDISYLPQCQKYHFAAFIQKSAILVVWDDDPNHILTRAQGIEDQLMAMAWKEILDGSEGPNTAIVYGSTSRITSLHFQDGTDYPIDPDTQIDEPRRVTVLIQPLLTAITLILVILAISLGLRRLVIEIKVDHSFVRVAILIVVPFQIWLALFFMQSLATGITQMIGPISQMKHNTKFFSGTPSPRLSNTLLPHVTIQCPVYKESLWSVIDPTVKSIKTAISTYEMQGGSANIFINDDGMQIISPEDAKERKDYYEEHGIGWVARPPHNPKPGPDQESFIRAGKFKKASNMNHALNVSIRVEDLLCSTDRPELWSQQDEQAAYDNCLLRVLQEDNGRTWAEGDIRIGDYILLVDSDTRVPTDCFLDAVSEMTLSPQVAIIQFLSGVMNVTDSWFEKGMTFFTNFIYTSIQYAVANGDVAPFVGHNAFLRWSAVQDVSSMDKNGQRQMFWSEETVSEDFDLALRLQTSGYILRLAAYAGQGFKEGVSLTVYDELARWEKYAYGCGELVFHPFSQWIFRGPFTPLFKSFLLSNMPLHSKVTIMAYVGTYYAIGTTWILSLMNYFLIGWYNGAFDHYYLDSFKVYFAIVMVFSVLGNVALAVLRYRKEERSLFGSLLENFKWLVLLTTFLGGISLHVSQAILCHLLGINMTWGATSKEAKNTSFFLEVPTILRKFRITFVWTFSMFIMMAILAGATPLKIPYDWQIKTFIAIWPLTNIAACHFLLPLVLNPGLMQFTF